MGFFNYVWWYMVCVMRFMPIIALLIQEIFCLFCDHQLIAFALTLVYESILQVLQF